MTIVPELPDLVANRDEKRTKDGDNHLGVLPSIRLQEKVPESIHVCSSKGKNFYPPAGKSTNRHLINLG